MGGLKIAIQRNAETGAWDWLVVDHETEDYADGDTVTWRGALTAATEAFRLFIEDRDETIGRDNQKTDVIYVGPDADPMYRGNLLTFVTPDGVGRYFYDSIAQARSEHGDLPVRYVARIED